MRWAMMISFRTLQQRKFYYAALALAVKR